LGELTIAEETLQPDDWLVLHTDGITEARDHTGEFFGETRLADFLHREAAAGHPPPETVRRLIRAVLNHQHGVLQDDATVLLARWTTNAPRSAS
jgi:serine phosphatase RsbU (regulator of sigma subunit)